MFKKTKTLVEGWDFMTKRDWGKNAEPFDVYKNPSKSELHKVVSGDRGHVMKGARVTAHKDNIHAWTWDKDVHDEVHKHPKMDHLPDNRDAIATGALMKHTDTGNYTLYVHDPGHKEWQTGSKVMNHLQSVTHPAKLTVSDKDFY